MSTNKQSEERQSMMDSGTDFLMQNPIGIGMLIMATVSAILWILPFAIRQVGYVILAVREVRVALLK